MFSSKTNFDQLFGREINDISQEDMLKAKQRALNKVLPGRIAFAEKVMNMTEDECSAAWHEILARQKRGGLVV